jgi:histidinol-phosphate aminotransferase
VTAHDLRYHGDAEATPGLVDFAVNVRAPAPPMWLHEVLADSLRGLGRYPDPTEAVEAVAARHGRRPDEVLPTAGAAEAFVLLARAVPARRPACVHPSFTEPEAALSAAGHDVHRVVLPAPYRLRPELVPDSADLVVVGNPTNPTGVLHDAGTLLELTRPGRVVVVDEAFVDTVPGEQESLAPYAGGEGLVVVRSLTKTWSVAGLRVGYVLAAPAVIAALSAAQPLWSVSTPALAALSACCRPSALAEADAAAVRLASDRDYLLRALAARGLRVVAPSRTSFLLVEVPDALAVRARLRAAGVAVRRGDTFPGLGPDHLRIAVRRPEVTDVLLAALDRILGASV